jgi:CRP-like cAMP-binding protein
MTLVNPDSARNQAPGARLVRTIVETGVPHSLVRCERDQIIYLSGKREESLYVVREGCVKITSYSAAGKPCIHAIEPEGGIFGELSFAGPVRLETAIAMRQSVVMKVPLLPLLDATARMDVLGQLLLYLADRVRVQQRLVNSLVTLDSEHRLAVVLLDLGRGLGRRHGQYLRIEERLSQEELSAMVGTTRSRVGAFLKNFRNAGLIRAEGAALLVDEEKMAEFAFGYNDSGDERGPSFLTLLEDNRTRPPAALRRGAGAPIPAAS